MKLLTKELRAKLPKLYETENTPVEEKTAIVKFFQPWGSWTWYGVECCAILEDGEEVKASYEDTKMRNLWQFGKAGEVSQPTRENDLQPTKAVQKPVDSTDKATRLFRNDGRQKSKLERRRENVSRLPVYSDAGASESGQTGICQKGRHSAGQNTQPLADTRRIGTSQRWQQIKRLTGQSGIEKKRKPSEIAYAREEEKRQLSRGAEEQAQGYSGEIHKVVDYLFFGLVHGFEKEWGYFSLKELESVTGPHGLKIERDLYFEPTKIKDIKT